MINSNIFTVIGKKNNQTSFSDAAREIPTLGSTDNTRHSVNLVSGIIRWPLPGHVAQSVGPLTRKSEVLGSIPGLATYFRFSFRFFKKGSCQLLAKVCARSTA